MSVAGPGQAPGRAATRARLRRSRGRQRQLFRRRCATAVGRFDAGFGGKCQQQESAAASGSRNSPLNRRICASVLARSPSSSSISSAIHSRPQRAKQRSKPASTRAGRGNTLTFTWRLTSRWQSIRYRLRAGASAVDGGSRQQGEESGADQPQPVAPAHHQRQRRWRHRQVTDHQGALTQARAGDDIAACIDGGAVAVVGDAELRADGFRYWKAATA